MPVGDGKGFAHFIGKIAEIKEVNTLIAGFALKTDMQEMLIKVMRTQVFQIVKKHLTNKDKEKLQYEE